jgi:hypothetical protein
MSMSPAMTGLFFGSIRMAPRLRPGHKFFERRRDTGLATFFI